MGLDKATTNASNWRIQAWIIPGVLILISVVLGLGGDDARLMFRYDRVWLAEGQTWRFISGHLSHLGWQHLVLNATGLGLVWFLVGRRYENRQWLMVIGMTLLVINMGFWILNPSLHWYVGLSGLLHGLLVAGILANVPRVDSESVVLGVLIIAKLVWEQAFGAMPGSETSSGGPVVVDAHLYGAVGGAISALVSRIRVLQRPSI